MNSKTLESIIAAWDNAWPAFVSGKTEEYLRGFHHGMNFVRQLIKESEGDK